METASGAHGGVTVSGVPRQTPARDQGVQALGGWLGTHPRRKPGRGRGSRIGEQTE